MNEATMNAFADELEKISAAAAEVAKAMPKWVAPTATHAAIGAGAGAVANKDDRFAGAAKGAVGGVVVGHAAQHAKRLHDAAKPLMKAKKVTGMDILTRNKNAKGIAGKAMEGYSARPLYP